MSGAGGIARAGDSSVAPPPSRAHVRLPLDLRIWTVSLPADTTRFDLPERWIVAGSLIATVGAETLRAGADYQLEPAEGILKVPGARERAGELRVTYRIVPLAIGRVFQQPIPFDSVRAASTAIAPRDPGGGSSGRANDPSHARLDLRGSKTVSLEIGSSQDLTLRQSLDVALTGEIAPGVTVRGVLSDRETPLQPEGRTTELSDLDRVYLQVEGRGASMLLGDFQLRGPGGLFGNYERQLEGISLRGSRGTASASVAAAQVPGEFVSFEFLGEEGKQGPYRLVPSGGRLFDSPIVAGSEKVWVDGELLVRGEDRDYVIDYAAGTITFTGRRLIDKDSRITVDLERSDQPYRRNAYAADISFGRAISSREPGLGFRASLFTERDDVGHPVGGALSDRERDALQAAGDSVTTDLASGVECGSPGDGDYEWVEADTLDVRFLRYVGRGEGTCRVRFDLVGEKNGDYADSLAPSGDTIFRYVGYRQGRWLPGRAVPRPSQRDMLDLQAGWIGPSGLSGEIEAAGSQDDPNTLSSRDDRDRRGGAMRLRFGRDVLPFAPGGVSLGKVGFRIETRDRDDRFRAIGRVDPSWAGYEWGVAEERLARGDRRRSAVLTQEPGLGFQLEGAYETLSNRRDLEGERSRLGIRRSGAIFGFAERARATTRDRSSGAEVPGERSVDSGMLGGRLAATEATVAFRRERTRNGEAGAASGNGFDEWRLGAVYRLPEERGSFELSRTARQDRTIAAGDERDSDRARTWEAHAAYSPPGKLLDARYTWRTLTRLEEGDTRSDVAALLWSQDRGDGWFGQQLRADLSTNEEEGKSRSLRYVGPGAGRYDSLGVYVGDGDYDLVLVPSGLRQLERRLDGSWRVDFVPKGPGEREGVPLATRLWSSSRWLLYASFSTRATGSAASFWRDLPQLLLARRDGVPLASHRLRMEGSALPRARWASPQIRLERERSRSSALSNASSRIERDLAALQLRSTPREGWTLEQEVQIDRDLQFARWLDSPSSPETAYGWRSAQLRLSAAWRAGKAWTLRAGTIGRTRHHASAEGDRVRIVQILPGVQWIPRERMRLDLQAKRTWHDGPRARVLGLERAGWEARGTLAVRLRSSLDASLLLDWDDPDGAPSRTNARMELRASF
ncbi:MAG: hypothetical protein ACE15D_12110 [Candidatus Eisenbacteria bacterium]